jgi:hypothetical protein
LKSLLEAILGFHLVPTIPSSNHSYFTLFGKFQNPGRKDTKSRSILIEGV